MAEIEAAMLELTAAQANSALRWSYEQEKLKRFPAFRFVRVGTNITGAVGALDTQVGNTYGVRVELQNFPFARPSVFPRDWTPHPEVPHRFNDGSLCVMRSDQWRTHFTAGLVIAKVAIWLGKYELWKRNGHIWPGLGQRH
jgi:hypothetical protein